LALYDSSVGEFKQIATPNNDTLYAQAFCDVSREPLIVSVPKVDDKRYYTLQLWDPNGDTFSPMHKPTDAFSDRMLLRIALVFMLYD
jgi:hypothetical protein